MSTAAIEEVLDTGARPMALEILNNSIWNQQCEELQVAIRNVLNLSLLKPCPNTNAAFACLVHAVIDHQQGRGSIYSVVEQGLVHRVREIAGLAEYELETMWARRIVNSPSSAATLAEFPYYANYEKLVGRELELVAQSGLRIHRHGHGSAFRVLFVGSGPLAMTSIIIHKALPHAYVENLDFCKKAIGLSERVADALGLGPTCCSFCLGDGATIQFPASTVTTTKFDLILVAALAGTTQQKKQAIIDNLRPVLVPGGRFLLRSATGARELLYPAVQVNKLSGVKALLEYHPTDDVINSVIVCSTI